jgi:hypothetical protein
MSSCLRSINAVVLTWVESFDLAVLTRLDQLMIWRLRPGFALGRAITNAA